MKRGFPISTEDLTEAQRLGLRPMPSTVSVGTHCWYFGPVIQHPGDARPILYSGVGLVLRHGVHSSYGRVVVTAVVAEPEKQMGLLQHPFAAISDIPIENVFYEP